MATIGLRDVHYALLKTDDASSGTATYDAPVHVVGAISANVNPNTSSATLFADDGPYDTAATMGEITLELNMADIPDETQAKWLGHEYKNGMLIKKSTDVPPWVALGYRSLKSNGAYRYVWLVKGKFAALEEEYGTKGDSVEFKTPTINGSFVKRDCDDVWELKADSDAKSPSSAIETWFTAVPNPGVGGA